MPITRFMLGLTSSWGVSILLLQHITDRRLLEYQKPDTEATRQIMYANLLRKMMHEKSLPQKEDELTQKVRNGWNESLTSLSKGVTAGARSITKQAEAASAFLREQFNALTGGGDSSRRSSGENSKKADK